MLIWNRGRIDVGIKKAGGSHPLPLGELTSKGRLFCLKRFNVAHDVADALLRNSVVELVE
jgi:hypothetical protein